MEVKDKVDPLIKIENPISMNGIIFREREIEKVLLNYRFPYSNNL